ncbi:MAG: discoidin domain-containing protein [Chitinophagales bacterium]
MAFNGLFIDGNSTSLQQQILNVAAGTSTVFSGIAAIGFLSAFANVPDAPTLLTPTGTVDFDNTTTQDANLINGDLTGDLIYNNSSQGTANKTLPAIDFGTPIAVGSINIHWHSTTYVCNSFDLEYSVDGTTWTAIGTYTGVWQGNSVTPQTVSFANIMARYVRIRCINGNHPDWFVLREMQAFSPAGSFTQTWLGTISDVSVIQDANGDIEINNQTSNALDITINYFA